MGVISLAAIDIGSALVGFLGAKFLSPKTSATEHEPDAVAAFVARVEANITRIKAAL